MPYSVMLVDDEYMILEGLKQIIPWENLGFEIVKTARTGKEALTYLMNHKIDLIVSDITMPELNGIELIHQAKGLGYDFATIFLSGYQEFEYVKEGIRLGVKDYLLKPVDQEELATIVSKIWGELNEQKHMEKQANFYFETSITRWLQDELNEEEFLNLVQKLNLSPEGDFTVVKIMCDLESLERIMQELAKKEQRLVIRDRDQNRQHVTLIFQGDNETFKRQLEKWKGNFKDAIQIYVGETVKEWENVYESYEKVLQIEELYHFYPDLLPDQKVRGQEELKTDEFSFLTFNKSLMIGDAKTIQEELDKIFQEVHSQRIQPENAKYIAFLLFTDISRQHPSGTKMIYEETIQKIRQSQTIYQLKQSLEKVLILVKEQPFEKKYF